MTRTEEANLLDFITYSQLTANVYPNDKDKNNPLSLNQGNWQQLELVDISGKIYKDIYDYDDIHKNDRDENGQLIYTNDKKIGLDAAIYKNKDGKVVVTFSK